MYKSRKTWENPTHEDESNHRSNTDVVFQMARGREEEEAVEEHHIVTAVPTSSASKLCPNQILVQLSFFFFTFSIFSNKKSDFSLFNFQILYFY